ncbi:hypothetical protein MP228_008886 [Amoeboaphelidium protococcarum]|nr:hypothetical protein MP228_008886 [Amoeboaphelidium protococcarum]
MSFIKRVPLAQIGWQFADKRCKSGISVGTSLLDGDYRSSWEFYKLPQRSMLVSSLAYLKSGKLPPGLMLPMDLQGRYLLPFTRDVIRESIRNISHLQNFEDSIFNRSYDVICPLPSSKGVASAPNVEVALHISQAISVNEGAHVGPPIEHLVSRVKPMITKSTETDRSIRRDRDAPRIMHFDTMKVLVADHEVANKRILLYDDVVTYGNTSEAARNLLLTKGAAEVDIISVFSTGPVMRSRVYEDVGQDVDVGEDITDQMTRFRLKQSSTVDKEEYKWKDVQMNTKQWHQSLGYWIEDRFPELIPNIIIDV